MVCGFYRIRPAFFCLKWGRCSSDPESNWENGPNGVPLHHPTRFPSILDVDISVDSRVCVLGVSTELKDRDKAGVVELSVKQRGVSGRGNPARGYLDCLEK